MCCHRLYVYTVCGHSTFSQTPLELCRNAGIPPEGDHSTTCELMAHPYKSWKFERLCPPCQSRRDYLMGGFESSQTVTYDEWQWKVSYGLGSDGKDYWAKRMEDKKRKEEEQMHTVKMAKNRKSRRFSFHSRRSKGRSKASDG